MFITGLPLDELLEKETGDLNEIEKNYLDDYHRYAPVSDTHSTMNKLCHLVEKALKKIAEIPEDKTTDFASMLKSVSHPSIPTKDKKQLSELYAKYRQESNLLVAVDCDSSDERIDKAELTDILAEDFRRKCVDICPDPKKLCDALLDICYTSDKSKKFVWDMCGSQIVENLLNRHGSYTFYVADDNGEIEFRGKRYRKITRSILDTTDKEEF